MIKTTHSSLRLNRSFVRLQSTAALSPQRIGFIGLGHMGSKMVKNLEDDGHKLVIYDLDKDAAERLKSPNVTVAASVPDIAKSCSIVFSMLPNDSIVSKVAVELLDNCNKTSTFTHVSCSTIGPQTSRTLANLYSYSTTFATYIACPVFARPDGIARREAIWVMSGGETSGSTSLINSLPTHASTLAASGVSPTQGKVLAMQLLSKLGRVEDYGPDAGAANVVKLCGNYMIASSIETIGEAMTLAEKYNVNSKQVIQLLTDTIFNCLIYKGYGQRVAQRDHRPGGFGLSLGQKDVCLVSEAAKAADTPMPFLSVLVDRFTSAKAKGRGAMDWSAIGLNIAEDAGLDISKDLARNKEAVEKNITYDSSSNSSTGNSNNNSTEKK